MVNTVPNINCLTAHIQAWHHVGLIQYKKQQQGNMIYVSQGSLE